MDWGYRHYLARFKKFIVFGDESHLDSVRLPLSDVTLIKT